MKIDFSQARSAQAAVDDTRTDLKAKAKDACRRRISAVMSASAQLNLAADAASGALGPVDMQADAKWRPWVKEMRATWPRLAAPNMDPAIDGYWPVLPQSVTALARKY